MHKAFFSKRISIVIVCIVFSFMCINSYAISMGFSEKSFNEEEIKNIKNNYEIQFVDKPVVGNAICCFDVNESGFVAVGTESIRNKIIYIYDKSGNLQYGYSLYVDGAYGMEWGADN